MKMAIYIMLALFLSGMASCGSEDSINPIPELGNPPFDLPRGRRARWKRVDLFRVREIRFVCAVRF